jgi:hypothetical protein
VLGVVVAVAGCVALETLGGLICALMTTSFVVAGRTGRAIHHTTFGCWLGSGFNHGPLRQNHLVFEVSPST